VDRRTHVDVSDPPTREFGARTLSATAVASPSPSSVYVVVTARLPAIFPTTDGQPAHIARVLFIPASAASAYLLNEDIGRSPDTLVCYVEITGSLSTGRIHRHIYYDTRTHRVIRPVIRPAHLGELVFDAQTGNLLMLSFVEGPNGTTPPTPSPAPTRTPYPRPTLPLPAGMPTAAPTVSPVASS